MALYQINESELALKSGRLCLEFANTMDWHASDRPVETLHNYEDLVDWAYNMRLLDGPNATALLSAADHDLRKAGKVFSDAIELREAIYRIFAGQALGSQIQAQDLAILNCALQRSAPRAGLEQIDGKYTWAWQLDPLDLWQPLWGVARSAASLLTSDMLARVGHCADENGCGVLFMDNTRNHSRRWCDMSGCGNRAKARRHYQKKGA